MMHYLYTNDVYRTTPREVSLFAKHFPTIVFYRRFLSIIFRASAKAKQKKFSKMDLYQCCFEVIQSLERIGVNFEITGFEYIRQLDTPCVIIANHMSMLETVVLPAIVQQLMNVTFIVKNSLLVYPVFRHIMQSLDPIGVGRTNPRQDLKIVFEVGTDRLKRGISVIVFPQTTRSLSFEPTHFNTIGMKLAQRANVPVIPLALLTDAWQNGKHLKDFGKIDPSKKVHFAFSKSMWIRNRGINEHQAVIQFISKKLKEWKQERERH